MRLALACVLLAALVAAGCGSSSGSGTSTTAAPGATTAASTETTGGIDPMEGASTTPVEGSVENTTATALLERVSLGRHEGFDRVVFQFENLRPGYRVSYVQRPIVEDGSGNEIPVEGGAVLLVRMEPASGFDLATDEGRLVYKGLRRIEGSSAGTSIVKEVVRAGDFEAVLAWAIGVEEPVDFRVRTLDDSARLVVDLRNH
jgi:hypothetical protein